MSAQLSGFPLLSVGMEVICTFSLPVRPQAAMLLSAAPCRCPSLKKLSALETNDFLFLHFASVQPIAKKSPLTRAEAEYGRSRASSSMPETTPERRKTGYDSIVGDAEESENVSMWDSNAEGIRRRWRTNRTPSSNSRSAQDRSDAYAPDTESSWQWWRSGPDDDDYEDDTDDDEDDDSIFSWLNLENFDMLAALSMLRWLLPAAAVFLPWLFGGPMFLMMGFAVFPLAQKLLGLVVPRDWKDALQGRKARSRQKQGKRSQSSNRGKQDFWANTSYNAFVDDGGEPDTMNSKSGDWERSFLHESINQGRATSKLGGWDDEEVDDNLSAPKAKARRNKNFALQRRQRRKEVPLFFRLLVALFPFLRSWGGFL